MPRADLLALTADDLATLSNRGTVKRAQRELETGEAACEIREEPDALVFVWTDGVTCRFPADKPIQGAVCSSGVAGISRHIIRSVLAYQRSIAAPAEAAVPSPGAVGAGAPPPVESPSPAVPATTAAEPAPHQKAWDPGAISDEDLVRQFRKPAVDQARRRFEEGVLVELTRGAKPVARFLDEGCTIRFLVPGDLRYVTGDCAESLLPARVPLAVWAFRQLPADQLAGLLSLQQKPLEPPRALLGEVQTLLDEVPRDGLERLPATWPQRLGRLEESLRREGLVWPADLVADLVLQAEMYRQHDARFDPSRVVLLVGEITARSRAILSGTGAVPQPLVRGTRADRASDIAGGKMIGVGLAVRPGRRHTTLHAYLQDADTGSVAAVERTFADPDPRSGERPRSHAELAGTVLVKGVTLAGIGSSQLLLKSGRRTAGGQLALPRTASSFALHPQNFQWEQLKPPLAAESFAQVTARLQSLPPTYLRPRRCTEDLHVVPLRGVDAVGFDSSRQRLTARLIDPDDGTALLSVPYYSRGAEGFAALIQQLESRGDRVRFVSGRVRSTGGTLEIDPVCLVIQNDHDRQGLLPAVPSRTESERPSAEDEEGAEVSASARRPVERFFDELLERLSTLFLTGLDQADPAIWSHLAQFGRQVGFVRLPDPLAGLTVELDRRRESIAWIPDESVRHIRDLALLAVLARESL